MHIARAIADRCLGIQTALRTLGYFLSGSFACAAVYETVGEEAGSSFSLICARPFVRSLGIPPSYDPRCEKKTRGTATLRKDDAWHGSWVEDSSGRIACNGCGRLRHSYTELSLGPAGDADKLLRLIKPNMPARAI